MDKLTLRISALAAIVLLATVAVSKQQTPTAASGQTIVTVPYTQPNIRTDSVDTTIRKMSAGGWRLVNGIPNEAINDLGINTRVVTLVFQR